MEREGTMASSTSKLRATTGIFALATLATLGACSSLSDPTSVDDVVNSPYATSYDDSTVGLESVKEEYNADLARLRDVLDTASQIEHALRAMEPVDRYNAQDVEKYNMMVGQYNTYADQYRGLARRFNHKYKAFAEGADGQVPTSPDNISLPDPIP
jgi:hypothetical protein